MKLTQFQEDALTEAVNIGIGRAASSLSAMVSAKVSLSVPSIRFCESANPREILNAGAGSSVISVTQGFDGGVAGSAAIVLSEENAMVLAQLLQGEECTTTRLDILQQGILEEVGNIILNGIIGSLANLMKAKLSYDVPRFRRDAFQLSTRGGSDSDDGACHDLLIAETRFDVRERSIKGSLLIVFNIGSARVLIDSLQALAV